jgi:uncharacterized membrane protein YbhN (UPF0104 family)
VSRPRTGLLLQLLASVVLLVLLAWRVPLEDARGALGRLRPVTLLACLALTLIAYVGRARRWTLLLRRSGLAVSAGQGYRLTLVGTFYGLFTPGRVGEFARVLHLEAPRSATLPSVVWDRVADVLLLELLCVPGFVFVPAWRGPLLAGFALVVLATAVGVALLASPGLHRVVARLLPALAGGIGRVSARSQELVRGGLSPASFAWGAFFYLLTFPAAWLLMRDLAPQASPLLLLGLPLLPLLGNLPIALGGLGLREQVSATVFHEVGAGAATGVVFSLAWFAVVTLVPGLLGVVLAAAAGRGPRVAAPGGGA